MIVCDPEQKGLFTFYKEQQQQQATLSNKKFRVISTKTKNVAKSKVLQIKHKQKQEFASCDINNRQKQVFLKAILQYKSKRLNKSQQWNKSININNQQLDQHKITIDIGKQKKQQTIPTKLLLQSHKQQFTIDNLFNFRVARVSLQKSIKKQMQQSTQQKKSKKINKLTIDKCKNKIRQITQPINYPLSQNIIENQQISSPSKPYIKLPAIHSQQHLIYHKDFILPMKLKPKTKKQCQNITKQKIKKELSIQDNKKVQKINSSKYLKHFQSQNKKQPIKKRLDKNNSILSSIDFDEYDCKVSWDQRKNFFLKKLGIKI